jgi:glutamine synthetase
MGFNPIPNTPIASYERGFGDFTMKADIDSIRDINYISDNKQLVFFSDLYDQNNKEITHAPRYLVRKVVSELKALGYSVQIQADINFILLSEKYKKIHENFHFSAITEHANLYNTLYKMNLDEFILKAKNSLKLSNINFNYISGDQSPGQFKVSLKKSDAMEFCDNITLLKLVNYKYNINNDI